MGVAVQTDENTVSIAELAKNENTVWTSEWEWPANNGAVSRYQHSIDVC